MSWFGKILKGVGKGLVNAISSVPIVGDIAESIMGDLESDQARSQQMSDSMSMMKYQNDLNMANWETQNAYNTPQMQLQRIMDAGLNPLSVGLDGNTAAQPAAVSGQAAPDISSLLNYQLLNMQTRAQVANLKQDTEAKKIANDVARAEAKEKIARANTEFQFYSMRDYEAYQAYVDEWNNTPPDNEHDWKTESQPDSDFKTWYYEDEHGNNNYVVNVPNLFGLDRRYQNIKFGYDTAKAERDNRKLNNQYLKLQKEIYEKYGDKVERAKLNQAMAIIRNALIQGNIAKLDYDTFSKLGIGPNVIRAMLQTAQQLSSGLTDLVGAGAMLMK